jgi:O-acetyl-ADP-ribose deacetylase (regulator of RNase III)/uncharacterized protein YwgA
VENNVIKLKVGNILKDESDAIVNTVNCVGVMGKGLALQFKKAYPDNFREYKSACNKGLVNPGKMFITQYSDLVGNQWVINFPTKKHWKGSSKIEFIEQGLIDLVEQVKKRNIRSIAIPPLGAGLGGLDWDTVKARIIASLNSIENLDVSLYEPKGNPDVKSMLINTSRPNMTRGRALLVKLLEFYFHKGYECSKIEVQKLTYFLQESGIELKLKYVAHKFGPYASNLNHVLERIDGHFITGFGDRVNRSEIKLIESSIKEADKFLANDLEAKNCLRKVEKLISGYETPLSMEVLATTHWVIKHENYSSTDHEGIKQFIHQWNEHKASWKGSYIKKAIQRLESCSWV